MNKKLVFATATALASLASAPAFAQRSEDVLIDIQLTIANGCIINSSANPTALLDFGIQQQVTVGGGQNPGPFDAQTAAGAITVLCNATSTTASFGIGPGQNDAGLGRVLTSPSAPGAVIPYQLFSASSRSPASEYLNTGNTFLVNGGVITTGVPFEITVFGRIPSIGGGRNVAGLYTDQVTGTLTF